MSRDGLADSRSDVRDTAERSPESRAERKTALRMDRLTLPRGEVREVVRVRDHTYRLRASEARILATTGAFRVVRADDLQPMRSSRDAWNGDLRSLTEQGLVQTKTVAVNRQPVAVVVLTRAGRDVLDANVTPHDGRRQEFHAGLVKPREIAHDSQIYRLFEAEGERIEAEGGRIQRVVLDYELKREYQTFLNRADKSYDADPREDLERFAEDAQLPVIDGHLELPDLRIEYETADGRLEYRDVELVTEHYSRSQLAGKARAGFAMYRAASARLAGGASRAGGTPVDPHHLEWLR
jgi:hypothetical protein